MSTEQNPPAFPTLETFSRFDEDAGKYREYYAPAGGMSLRDYFAAHALAWCLEEFGGNADDQKQFAEAAYQIADLMLKARSDVRGGADATQEG